MRIVTTLPGLNAFLICLVCSLIPSRSEPRFRKQRQTRQQFGGSKEAYVAPEKYVVPNSPARNYGAPQITTPVIDYFAPNSPVSTYTSSESRRPLIRGYVAPKDKLGDYNSIESVHSETRSPPARNYKAPQATGNRATFYDAPQTNVVSFFDEDDSKQPTYGGGVVDDNLKMLMDVIPGVPGQDYPIYGEIPPTSFSCQGRVFGGFYGDTTTQCQVFHVCGRRGEKYSFLCPNGTIFHQNYLTCDFWYNSDCSQTESFYSINERIQAERSQQGPGAVADYGRQGAQELPVYSPVRADQYGRRGKALELQETISLTSTTPPPRTATSQQDLEDYDDYLDNQVDSPVNKRDLNLHGRQSQKYSWATF